MRSPLVGFSLLRASYCYNLTGIVYYIYPFKMYIVTVSYQYMSSLCYFKIHLLGFICCCCTSIYNQYVILWYSKLILSNLYLYHKIWIILIVILCNTMFYYKQVHLQPLKWFDHWHTSKIERRGSFRVWPIIARKIMILF